jgi:hypothetical protein
MTEQVAVVEQSEIMQTAPRRSILEQYIAESDEREVLAPSGYVWLVSGMTKVDFAEMMGGLPPVSSSNGSDSVTKEDEERARKMETWVYEHKVRGVKDPETGEVAKPPADRVLMADWSPVIGASMNRAGLGSANAAEVRRAL